MLILRNAIPALMGETQAVLDPKTCLGLHLTDVRHTNLSIRSIVRLFWRQNADAGRVGGAVGEEGLGRRRANPRSGLEGPPVVW